MGKRVSEPRDAASSLSASEAALYRVMVKNFPLGMAVLHLSVPLNVATWRIVAINPLATRIAGSSAAAFLSLAITPKSRVRTPADLESLCRQVVARRRGHSAGYVSVATPGAPEFYAISVFPLGQN